MGWFANKGQIIQTALTFVGVILTSIGLMIAAKKAYPDMAAGNVLSAGAILFYLLLLLLPVSIGLAVRGNRAVGSDTQPKLPPLLGYDRLIPARSSREGTEEGFEKASHIWFASIAGAHLIQFEPGERAKIDRVLLVDPESEFMKIVATVQGDRGKAFPDEVRETVRICKGEQVKKEKNGSEIAVRLSKSPFLNVILFDPGTPHAWARVQEFIPYHRGPGALVYAIRKEEWEKLYDMIEDSFKQTWENGKAPNK